MKYDEGKGDRLVSNVGLLAFHSISSAFVCMILYIYGGIRLKYYEGQGERLMSNKGLLAFPYTASYTFCIILYCF